MEEKIDAFSLENGFNCCFRQLDYYQNFVTMALAVRVGSTSERVGQRGIAHLLEHLSMSFWTFDLCKGIKYRTKAYTDFNETIFYIKCPADEINLRKCIKIVLNIAQGKFLDEKYFYRAQKDVLEEIGEEKKKQSIADILLKDSDYAKFYAVGKEEDVARMKYSDVVNFFERFYSANIMSLSIVGDIQRLEELKEYMKDLFSHVKCFPVKIDRKRLYIPEYKNKIDYVSLPKENEAHSEINMILKVCKGIIVSKKEAVKAEIIEKIALDIILAQLEDFLKEKGWEASVEYEYKDLDIFYMFYIIRIKTGNLDRKCVEKVVSSIKTFLSSQYIIKCCSDKEVYARLEEFYKIDFDSDLYYSSVGMHQILLECIDMYIMEKPILTYKEKCMLYEKIAKEVRKEEIYSFIKLLVMSDRSFVINI